MNKLFKRWDEIVTRPIHLWHSPDRLVDREAEVQAEAKANRDAVLSRYAAARFPGVLRNAADLGRIAHVIKSARNYLDDGNVRRAEELLDFARKVHPQVEALWLARLELAMRVTDAEGYRAVALAYRDAHPDSLLWAEVAAFARSLCLTDDAFSTDEEPSILRRDWLHTRFESSPESTPRDLRCRILHANDERVAA